MSTTNDNGSSTWTSWLLKQGTTTVLLVGMAVFVAWYLVIPMRDMQQKMQTSAVETNELNAKTNALNAATNVANAALLATVVETQKKVIDNQNVIVESQKKISDLQAEQIASENRRTKILEEIRDDQRAFPAVAARRDK